MVGTERGALARAALLAASALALCACSVTAPPIIRTTSVKDFIAQVKCEIAAGVNAAENSANRDRVKGWVAKSVLQIKGDEAAAVAGKFSVTPLAPAPSISLGFGKGEGFSEANDITFVDALDTMGRPICATGGIDPEPGNNLGLAAWVQESLSAFGPGNKTQFRQLGRTIVFAASTTESGAISFAVAPASADLSAERKRSDTHTLTIAMAEREQPQTYKVQIVSGPPASPPPGGRSSTTGEAPLHRQPLSAAPPRGISDTTIQNLNRTIDRQFRMLGQ